MDFPGKNSGEGRHFLLQGIFLTQGSNLESPTSAGGFFTTEPPGKLHLLSAAALSKLLNLVPKSLHSVSALLLAWLSARCPVWPLLDPTGSHALPSCHATLLTVPFMTCCFHTAFIQPAIQVSAQSLPLSTVEGSDYAIGGQHLQSCPDKAHSLAGGRG